MLCFILGQTMATSHGVVFAQSGMPPVGEDIKADRCDEGGAADNGECEEGFVGPTDGDPR